MAKQKKTYVCSECNEIFTKWVGQCSSCKSWNSVDEQVATKKTNESEVLGHTGYAGRSFLGEIRALSEVEKSKYKRIKTGFNELDKVMGGTGAVDGSVTLIGGDPGIGKSTILTQVLGYIAENSDRKTLYITGEESESQINMRAERLGLDTSKIHILSEVNVELIQSKCQAFKPDVIIIDSIQTVFTTNSTSSPGSPTQLRESTQSLTSFSKQNNITTFIIGHVTKDGSIAGPKILEHIVDTVLYFEGEKDSKIRMIRSMKNRFGEVNEIAVFSMEETGLKEETNPSAIFLNKHESPVSGSSIVVTREGTKNLIIEVQSLIAETSADNPQKRTIGMDRDRLLVIEAILSKRMSIPLWKYNTFSSVVGGVKITETAIDLPITLCILSSYHEKCLPSDLAAFGELGLAGEIRAVVSGEERIKEAIKQGIKQFIISKNNLPKSEKLLNLIKENNIKIHTVSNIEDVLNVYQKIIL